MITKFIFENNGNLYIGQKNTDILYPATWSKGVVINKIESNVCEYTIKNINNEDIMFVEWKSGDYTFGGYIEGYYVFKKQQ